MLTSASDRLWAECGSNDLLSLRHTKISIVSHDDACPRVVPNLSGHGPYLLSHVLAGGYLDLGETSGRRHEQALAIRDVGRLLSNKVGNRGPLAELSMKPEGENCGVWTGW